MPVRFSCKSCHSVLSVSRKRIGSVVRCPACKAEITVPGAAAEQAAPPNTETDPWAHLYSESPPGGPASRSATADSSPPPSRAPHQPLPPTRLNIPTRPLAPEAATQRRGPAASADAGDERPLKIRRVQTEFEDMDLTPMVDVTFLLLIFFMYTASFTVQKTIQIPAPDPDRQSAAQSVIDPDELEKNSIIVQIDPANRIFIDYEPAPEGVELSETFRDRMQSERKRELVVEADPRAFHETVVRVVDAANAAEFQRIRLATVSGAGGE